MHWPTGDLDLGSAPTVQTNDVDQARELLRQAYLPMEVRPIGSDPFDLLMNAVQLELMTAGYIRFAGQVMLRAPDVRSYHVAIPLPGHATNTWYDGQQHIATASESA